MSDDDLLKELSALQRNSNYTPAEKYHDFRRLFMGSAEGQRVLHEIISWGRLMQPAVHSSPIDPYMTHIREGEANIVRRLMVTVFREPNVQPPAQKRVPVRRSTTDKPNN